jgi:hypothetical protein
MRPTGHRSKATMMDEAGPALSVVLPTDRLETMQRTLSHLSSQTARDELELVIVAPSDASPGSWRSELGDFRHVVLVEVESVEVMPAARAAGVRAATAPVVAFTETHCFPDPSWAAALIAAHRGPWAAVGPAIGNANPRRPTSWGNLFADYGPWTEPVASGAAEHLPGHNTSYKRSVLLRYGEDLDRALEAESVVHWQLTAQGHRLFLESAARTRHHNMTRALPAAVDRFHNNRLFGAARGRGWSRMRRIAYAAGAPLMPPLRVYRIVGDMRRTGRHSLLPRALPAIVVAVTASAVGEAMGYVAGRGDSYRRQSEYELHRERFADAPDERP